MERGSKKGQIAIFAIIAVVIVSVIVLLFFTLSGRGPTLTRSQEFNLESFVDICVRDALREKVDLVLERGGLAEPVNYRYYDDIPVNYICYNQNNYFPCINQYPSFVSHVREEIEEEISTDLDACFSSLKSEMEGRGYTYFEEEHEFDVILLPGRIDVEIDKEVSFSKGGEENRFEFFSASLASPAYDLAFVANEIARQESQSCHFSYDGFTLLYPEFDIRKSTLSDSTKIYTVKHTKTQKVANIAVRGCVIPLGF